MSDLSRHGLDEVVNLVTTVVWINPFLTGQQLIKSSAYTCITRCGSECARGKFVFNLLTLIWIVSSESPSVFSSTFCTCPCDIPWSGWTLGPTLSSWDITFSSLRLCRSTFCFLSNHEGGTPESRTISCMAGVIFVVPISWKCGLIAERNRSGISSAVRTLFDPS